MTNKQLRELEKLAEDRDYGSGPAHSKQVEKLTLEIYGGIVSLGLLTESNNDRRILSAAAWLHNIGVPADKHNQVAFDRLRTDIPAALITDPLPAKDLSAILYCVLWHRGNKHKSRADVKIIRRPHVTKLAAILRVADALDRSFTQKIDDVSVTRNENSLEFKLSSSYPVVDEIERAQEKANLLIEAFGLKEISFKIDQEPAR